MASIPPKIRQQVFTRARGYCEYCQAGSRIIIWMEIDHIKPESDGGASELHNLCLSCTGCNSFKQHFQTGIDPDTSEEMPLFNPRQQR